MTASAFFWNLIANNYARSPVSSKPAYEKKRRITEDYLRPDMRALEFGCGSGSIALFHSISVRHIHAIDFSYKMIAIAKRKAEEIGVKNVRFERAAIEEFVAERESFDVVMSFSTVHLLEDYEAAFDKVLALLKPDGLFIISVACLGETMPLIKPFLAIGYALRVIPLVRVFSLAQLRQSLIDAGFVIVHQSQPEPDSPESVFFVLRKKT